jgi:FkbM family methyltransferase
VHLEVGRNNARLNGCEPVFIHAYVGPQPREPEPFTTESSGNVELSCVSVASLIATYGIEHLDILHCDAQGIETAVLESCSELFSIGRVSWVFVSTHSHHISRDPLTHQRCLTLLLNAGATIVAEHDVQESFSGDGLIVAKFGALPKEWAPPALSYNRYSDSLFRNPLYDLATASHAAQHAVAKVTSAPVPRPVSIVEASRSFALSGGLLTITEDCPLGSAGETLLLPFDEVMFPSTLAHSGWQIEELRFLEQHIDAEAHYAVLDIGANVGLFTAQLSRRFPNIERFFCVEADPSNFRALRYNLGGLPDGCCSTWNVALSKSDAEQEFFRDIANFGNYSLNSDAMRGRQFRTIKVHAVATDAWMNKNIKLDPNIHLIWKSDTQGYDELIISLTPMGIWERVDFAIVELWRIDKPDFDIKQFRIRLESFPNRSIGVGNSHSIPEVIEFLSGNDWAHEDLYLWR